MDANSENTNNNKEDEKQSSNKSTDLNVVSFPTLQEQTTFKVAISKGDEELINTLNIRDYFFFSI